VESNINKDDLTNLEILKCVGNNYSEGRRKDNESWNNIISLSLQVSTTLSSLAQLSILEQSSLQGHATHLAIN